ncbi:TetR/AcrR family transcriptional regulator [Cohnella suwonensis]|uniref:TetR/AcrR family transcriptional regulator n=1 Tax=Cohnella suwonensis TaxID=696072 RepID=A0ABW0LYZ8_9BACL
MSSNNLLDKIIQQSKLSKKETAKQQRIVETAIALFAERGYAHTSTSEIAKHSGVAEGTIFRHYGTKENLLLSVIVPFLKESMPSLAEEISEQVDPRGFGSFGEFVRALIRNRFEFLMANREIFRVVAKEMLYRDELRAELFPHVGGAIFGFLGRALAHFKERGELADIPPPELAKLMLTTIAGSFVARIVLAPEPPGEEAEADLERLARFVLEGCASGRAAL